MNILLFDVDGVLVEDRGYRASLIATINYYSRMMGQGDSAPDEAAIEVFHAHGYTNEWEICPLAIGALVVLGLRARPDLPLTPAPLDDFLAQFRSVRAGPIDYRAWIAGTTDRPGRPSERALSALKEALAGLPVPDSIRAAAASTLDELLADPYDFANAALTQVFQEHALGSSLFEEVYRMRPRFDVPSLLYNEDRSALDPAARSALLNLVADTGARLCVYTARPSLPPADIVSWLTDTFRLPPGFSPEAELAMHMVDLGDFPLIAMGRMQWLADRVGARVEYLTKPAPVQALAAIIAAVSRRESEALQSAYRMVSEGEAIDTLAGLEDQSIDVWVVEDARLGVSAAAGAIDLLRKHNLDVRLHALGVSAGGPKADALAGLCEAIVPTVNDAITYIVDRIRAAQLSTSNLQSPTSNPSTSLRTGLQPPTSS